MRWVGFLAGWAVLLQSLELLQLHGPILRVWNWRQLSGEYPPLMAAMLGLILDGSGLLWLLRVRCLAAALLMVGLSPPPLVAFLLLTTVLLAMRFRGTFNGGSDSMTVVVLTALLLPGLGLAYLALQTTLSYFVAGCAKARHLSWRNGSALEFFLEGRLRGGRARVASWLVLAWQCSFPLALSGPGAALGYCCGGLLFHAANLHYMGLNRFLWIWLACYPAVYQFSCEGFRWAPYFP